MTSQEPSSITDTCTARLYYNGRQHSSTYIILDTVEARRFESSIYPIFNWLFS